MSPFAVVYKPKWVKDYLEIYVDRDASKMSRIKDEKLCHTLQDLNSRPPTQLELRVECTGLASLTTAPVPDKFSQIKTLFASVVPSILGHFFLLNESNCDYVAGQLLNLFTF